MDHIGIDVHKKESQICILAEGDELIDQRIRTEPERFAAVLGQRPRARIVIEASTDSEWVARYALLRDGSVFQPRRAVGAPGTAGGAVNRRVANCRTTEQRIFTSTTHDPRITGTP